MGRPSAGRLRAVRRLGRRRLSGAADGRAADGGDGRSARPRARPTAASRCPATAAIRCCCPRRCRGTWAACPRWTLRAACGASGGAIGGRRSWACAPTWRRLRTADAPPPSWLAASLRATYDAVARRHDVERRRPASKATCCAASRCGSCARRGGRRSSRACIRRPRGGRWTCAIRSSIAASWSLALALPSYPWCVGKIALREAMDGSAARRRASAPEDAAAVRSRGGAAAAVARRRRPDAVGGARARPVRGRAPPGRHRGAGRLAARCGTGHTCSVQPGAVADTEEHDVPTMVIRRPMPVATACPAPASPIAARPSSATAT